MLYHPSLSLFITWSLPMGLRDWSTGEPSESLVTHWPTSKPSEYPPTKPAQRATQRIGYAIKNTLIYSFGQRMTQLGTEPGAQHIRRAVSVTFGASFGKHESSMEQSINTSVSAGPSSMPSETPFAPRVELCTQCVRRAVNDALGASHHQYIFKPLAEHPSMLVSRAVVDAHGVSIG